MKLRLTGLLHVVLGLSGLLLWASFDAPRVVHLDGGNGASGWESVGQGNMRRSMYTLVIDDDPYQSLLPWASGLLILGGVWIMRRKAVADPRR